MNNLCKTISMVLITIFFLSAAVIPAYALEDRDDQGFGLKPNILITAVEYPEVVSRGETFDVVLSFVNNGVGFAHDLTYFVELENHRGPNPIGIIDAPKILKLNSGQRQNVSIRMRVNENANLGDYRVFWKIDYKNRNGIPQETSSVTRSIRIDLGKTSPEFVITRVDLADGGSGRHQATFTYQNMGDKAAQNLTATFEGGTNYLVVETSNKKHLGDLAGKRTGTVSFLIEERESITEETATIAFGFEDDTGATQNQSLQVYLGTGGTSSGAGRTPWVILNQYSLSADQILAGNRVVLSLFIENTHPRPVKNLKLSLGVIRVDDDRVGGTVFSPVDSSNTFFIETIDGRSVIRKDVELFVDANAAARTYIVPLEIIYEDERGRQLNAEELINIPVVQSSMMEILSVDYPKEVFLGDMVNITSEFVNTGRVELTNFRVNIEGDFGKDNTMYYVGTLDQGMSDFYQGRIIPEQEGLLEGVIVFTYLDAGNEEIRVEREISMNVMPMQHIEHDPYEAGERYPMDPGFKQGRSFSWLPVLLGVAVVAQGFVIFRMKRKQAKDDFYE